VSFNCPYSTLTPNGKRQGTTDGHRTEFKGLIAESMGQKRSPYIFPGGGSDSRVGDPKRGREAWRSREGLERGRWRIIIGSGTCSDDLSLSEC